MASSAKAFQEIADKIFSKSYMLKTKDNLYSLPDIDTIFSTEPFEMESLIKMRDELNKTKSLLNDKDIEKWRNHTRKANPCGLVVKQLKEKVNPELCTQAWAKFYEILNTCDVIPSSCITSKTLKTLHLCEAPGAFITCLNQYIKSKFEGMKWNWLGTTLNPFYEGNDTKRMIEGEKFILETQEHWDFGECFDGDIMNWKNLEHLQQTMAVWGKNEKADIVTADGSIDCADEPEKQETTISQLLSCEVVASLRFLAPGGCFVVKMFTMFEHNTVCLLYLLSCCFQEIKIVKPGTSKAGNSEVYCVSTGFIGTNQLPRGLFEKLRLHFTSQPDARSLFPKDILPATFVKSIENCAKTFCDYQTDAIKQNIDLFERPTKGKRRFSANLQHYVASEYLRRFNVAVLGQASFVVSHTHLTGNQLSFWPEVEKDFYHHVGYHTGCYQERVEMANLSWQDRVVFPRNLSNSFKCDDDLIRDLAHVRSIRWLTGSSIVASKRDPEDWRIRFGKPIEMIRSSRFCPSAYIEELEEARRNATVLHAEEGRRWLEQIEQSAQEKLSPTSLPHNFIDAVLRQCDLLDSKSRFVDISGNCRFLAEVVRSGCYDADQCSGLLCSCCSKRNSSSSTLSSSILAATNCCSYTYEEASRLNSICAAVDGSANVICGTVFADCGISGEYGELSSREPLLNQCLTALRILRNDDCFVCEVSDTLTQFTAGVLYILHIVFKDVCLLSVAGKLKSTPKQFLVCRSYIPSNNIGLTEYMGKCVEVIREKSGHQDLVCILPTSNLFSKMFYLYLREHTTSHIKNQLHFIVDLKRVWLNKQRLQHDS